MRLRKKLSFVLFFLFSVLLFAEGDSPSTGDEALPSESGILLDADTEKTTDRTEDLPSRNETGFDLNVAERSQSSVSVLLRILISLLVVCILAYVVLKFIKKYSTTFSSEDPYLKSVASINLAQGKSIHVITLGEKAYLVGVTDSSINMIGEVEDKILVDTMNLEAERRSSLPKRDFASMLSSVFKNTKNNGIDVNFFEAQRERLNNAAKGQPEERE
ncbi:MULTISPECIES: flagellar biosynthetic protein FliO [unclassified Treponema]|uniref:flagellar biosynthetic protein FliO n=1 Tax=unclassified Treponema TaxID=2638727 RepID=UPI0020A2AEC2|nr:MULTISPECIES: flagellar biosynthetic protein FliO [unclassified Treponema]UTC66478.1 flagellar biosynthetic protein FliO [Treponema sp. OMZ 789]UTC69210.1 flagellar biosynthetic protein FliO [Treponema sp. OMZ 790]UTC71923.1 flagellar biosynthetic protein FliO [Treponema sp. OMZ 791]